MSDLSIFAIGLGLGLLIVMPVIYVLRHEIASNARKLLGFPTIEEEDTQEQRETGEGPDDIAGNDRSEGITPVAAAIGAGAAALSFLWGVVSSNVFFTISGAVVAVAVLLAFTAGKMRGSSR
jgi:hypothetical protein